jgi:glycosyltransferase 2 family protein
VSKRTLLNLGKYLLAFGLLVWVVSRNWAPPGGKGLKYVWQRHVVEGAPVGWGYLAGAALCFSFALVLTLVRWFVLVRAQGLPFRFPDALRLGLIGFFFNTFLPGSVGGDIIKAAFLAREQSRRTVAVATVIMDRVIALWGLIWFVAVLGAGFWAAGLLGGEAAATSQFIVKSAAGIVAVTAAAWLLLGLLPAHRAERFAGRLGRVPRVGGSAAEFWRAVWMYRCRQKSVALALLISWVGFFGFIGTFYCCAHALWDDRLPSLTQHFLIVPIGLVIQAMPLFPGGAGIGEAGFAGLYSWFGYDPAGGVLGSLVQRVLSWVLGLGGLAVYVWLPPRLPGRASDAEPVPEPALAGVGADGDEGCAGGESLSAD